MKKNLKSKILATVLAVSLFTNIGASSVRAAQRFPGGGLITIIKRI